MSLTNSFERQLAKNLLLVGVDATTYKIDGKASLFMGLHVGSALVESGGGSNAPTPSIDEPGSPAGYQGGADATSVHPTTAVANGLNDVNNYARVPMDDSLMAGDSSAVDAFDEAEIDVYQDGPLSNAEPVRFPIATASWGTVYSWFLTDTEDLEVLGDVTLWGNVNTPTAIENQDRAIFNDGALSITIQ